MLHFCFHSVSSNCSFAIFFPCLPHGLKSSRELVAMASPPCPDPTDAPNSHTSNFSVLSQTLNLNIDFVEKSIHGRTELTVQPLLSSLTAIQLDCRYCRITSVTVSGHPCKFRLSDPFSHLQVSNACTVNQHHIIRQHCPPDTVPSNNPSTLPFHKLIIELCPPILSVTPGSTLSHADVPQPETRSFASFVVSIEYTVIDCRESLHFVGLCNNDYRYPQVFSNLSQIPGLACAMFPCIDDLTTRYPWVISFSVPRTLAHIYSKTTRCSCSSRRLDESAPLLGAAGASGTVGSCPNCIRPEPISPGNVSTADMELPINVIATGDMVDDVCFPLVFIHFSHQLTKSF